MDYRDRLRALFDEAVSLLPAQRAAFLDQACQDDPALRKDIESLLQHHDQDLDFLKRLAEAALPTALRQNAPGEVLGTVGEADPMLGQTISHFQIESKLGGGGMGLVYKARDTSLDRTVALKFLPPYLSLNNDAKQRFKHEARSASALDHINLCTIHEIGETADGQLFIAMAYYAGETLKKKIERGPLPIDEALDYAVQIAKGLKRAHEAGIVHRDIKSANVIITERGLIKIVDFGLAKRADVSLTPTGATLGTAAYMSPEQAQGATVDHRTDIWSLGVVLYELLTGQRPFRGDYPAAVVYSILNEDPISPSVLRPEISKTLEHIVEQTLAKRAADRYPDMDSVLAALRGLQDASYSGTETLQAMPVESHMVGRDRELAELEAALEHVAAGQSLLLAVGGEAGIGKTTLVEAFLQQRVIGVRSCTTTRGQCSERLAGTEAYLPFLDVLDGLLQREGAYATLMRERAPWWYARVASLSPDDPADAQLLEEVKHTSQEQVKRELATFLKEASRRRPLVLFFEDLHWADVSTIDMLAYLGAKFDAMRVLIVATYRPAEMVLAEHSFLQIKPDLLSRGRCREVELRFLTRADIARYLSLEYPGHSFPQDLARLVHEKTEGSPLFMVDLVRDLQDRGVIVEEGDRWHLTQTVSEIRLALPGSVKGMIERKIQQLSPDDHLLLTTASVQGFEFDSAVVAPVLDLDEEEVEERLQRLESDHRFVQLMEEAEFPDRTLTLRYRFVHVLYQNELYASLTRTRRVRLSRSIGEALEGFYGERVDEVASELASLFEEARAFEKAIDYYARAAEHVAGVFAYRESTTLAQRGLDLLRSLRDSPERDQQELELQMTLGSSATAVFGYANPEVGETYHRIRELVDKVEASRQVILSTFGLHSFYLATLDMQEALDLCAWYLDLARQRDDHTLLFFGHVLRAVTLYFMGDFATGLGHFEEAFAVYEPHMDEALAFVSAQDVVMAVVNNYPWNLWLRGYPDQAIQNSNRAKELAEMRSNPHVLTHRFVFAGFLYLCLRDADKVLALSEANIALSEEHGFPWPLTLGRMNQGWALAQLGQREEGLRIMHEGLEAFRLMGFEAWIQTWHAEMAVIYGQMGQPEKGLAVLEESFAVVERTLHRMWEAELHRIKGELLLQQGTVASEVEECYENALDVARRQQAKSFELRAAMSLSRLWQQQGRGKEAHELLSDVYGWFTEGFDTRDLQDAKVLLEKLLMKMTAT